MSLIEDLEYQLNKPNHIVKVTSGETRLSKGVGEKLRFSFSLDDILNKFSSLENFIDQLKILGFSDTEFHYQKIYERNEKVTYHTMSKNIINLNEIETKQITQQPVEQSVHTSQAKQPTFLAGNVPPTQDVGMLGVYLKAERSEDHKREADKLAEELKDLRSKNRLLTEDNNALQRKLDTAEDRAELKYERKLIDKKGFMESDAFQAFGEGLGKLLPSLLPLVTGGNTAQGAQLGVPDASLSETKQELIEIIKKSHEQHADFLHYVSHNMSKELVDVLTKHIEDGE